MVKNYIDSYPEPLENQVIQVDQGNQPLLPFHLARVALAPLVGHARLVGHLVPGNQTAQPDLVHLETEKRSLAFKLLSEKKG